MTQSSCVARIAKNKTINTIVNNFRDTGAERCNRRQATCHRLRHGKPERIFPARTDVNVRSRVKIEDIGTRNLPTAAVLQSELHGARTERLRQSFPTTSNRSGKREKAAIASKIVSRPLLRQSFPIRSRTKSSSQKVAVAGLPCDVRASPPQKNDSCPHHSELPETSCC